MVEQVSTDPQPSFLLSAGVHLGLFGIRTAEGLAVGASPQTEICLATPASPSPEQPSPSQKHLFPSRASQSFLGPERLLKAAASIRRLTSDLYLTP